MPVLRHGFGRYLNRPAFKHIYVAISYQKPNYGRETTCPLSSVHRPSHILPCVLRAVPPPRCHWLARWVRAQRPSSWPGVRRCDSEGAGRDRDVQPRTVLPRPRRHAAVARYATHAAVAADSALHYYIFTSLPLYFELSQ